MVRVQKTIKNVKKNLMLIAEKMRIKKNNLFLMHQTHSNKVVEIKKKYKKKSFS